MENDCHMSALCVLLCSCASSVLFPEAFVKHALEGGGLILTQGLPLWSTPGTVPDFSVLSSCFAPGSAPTTFTLSIEMKLKSAVVSHQQPHNVDELLTCFS